MKPSHVLAVCTALLVVAGCDQVGNKSATTIDTNAGFEAFVQAAARKSAAELTPDEVKEGVNQYVNMQVAAEAARKAGLDKDPDVAVQLELNRLNVLSETFLRRHLEANPASDAEIQAEYETQVAGMSPEYKARHILVDDEALAKAIIEKLKAKGDFAALAKEYSRDGSGLNGGELGWFSLQTMVPEFSEAVAALEKGRFSEAPVKSQFGWHVILLEDTRTQEPPALDLVRDRVAQIVQRKKIGTYLDELRKASTIDAEKLTASLTDYASKPAADAAVPIVPPGSETPAEAPAEPQPE